MNPLHILGLLVFDVIVLSLALRPKKSQPQISYITGIKQSTYPNKRPDFNTWARFIKLQNYKASK